MKRRKFQSSPLPDAPLVIAGGELLVGTVEENDNPDEVDHFWITMHVGGGIRILVSINTLSRRNRIAGFDPRVRVGIIKEEGIPIPAAGATILERFDYADLEVDRNVYFEHHSRAEIEDRLMSLTRRAQFLEAWGAPYLTRGPGIHQIHSRRRSCAVPEDIVGRDGGLRFFLPHGQVQTLLFKFCGQP